MQLVTTQNMRNLPSLHLYAPHYAFLRSALRVGAHLSDGLAIGAAYGFDSGLMLDYAYHNLPSGQNKTGEWIDRIFLHQLGWRAARARKELLQRYLTKHIQARRTRGDTTQIFDIASGPGRYVIEVISEFGGEDIRALCRDIDASSIAEGRRIASHFWLSDRIHFERGDATNPDDLARVAPQPDIVIASGLYEILNDDAAVCRSLAGVRTLLRDGGILLFTTQISHPQLKLIANVLTNRHGQPWVMGTRSLARVERWAREAGFSSVGSEMESHGMFAVTQCAV